MRLLVLGLAGAVLGACVHHAQVSKHDYLVRVLATRAGFDLQCAPDQVAFTDLGPQQPNPYFWNGTEMVRLMEPMSTQQGATACGKRAAYVYAGRPSFEWLMDAPK